MPERRNLAALFAAACWASVAFAPTGASAQDADPVWGEGLERRAARPYIIVAPRYPKEAGEQKRTATVDVVGPINEDGMMLTPLIRSSSTDAAFEKEVSEVIHLWIFKAPVDGLTCKPKTAEGQLRVWFEIGDDGPKVSISMQKEDVQVNRERKPSAGAPRIVQKDVPVFPRSAIKRGVNGARVIALLRVVPSGDVAEVLFQNTGADREFYEESQRALKRWKFDMASYDFKNQQHACVEIPISFKLTW